MSTVDYQFLPWLRTGSATLITTPDSAGAEANYATSVTLEINNNSQDSPSIQVYLYGPGDIVGIEPRQIIRVEPAPGRIGNEPNYFPLIEFREPDFPWRYTPTAGTSPQDPLRPWLTLIALEQQGDLAVRQIGNAPLPQIAAPFDELPDLEEASRWVHVQLVGPFNTPLTGDAEQIQQYINQHPQRAIARILCPRRLKPKTDYLICLVPTFEVGRLAGLGQDTDTANLKLQPAWQLDLPQPPATINLPVYYSWSFRTGDVVDSAQQFEKLARALTPYSVGYATQPFQVDPVLFPGGEASAAESILYLEGALRTPLSGSPAQEPIAPTIQANLEQWINMAARVEDNGGDPQVTPPLYGRWQSGCRQLNSPQTPFWVDELNLNPRHRIVAAAGGDLVQKYQDEFIHEAWQQVGALREANQMLRGAQMACMVGRCLKYRHFNHLTPDRLLQVAGPIQPRIPLAESTDTLYKAVAGSSVPEVGFEGEFRRVARVRGPHLRKLNTRWTDVDTTLLFGQGGPIDYFYNSPPSWADDDEPWQTKWQWTHIPQHPYHINVNLAPTTWTLNEQTEKLIITNRNPRGDFRESGFVNDIAALGTVFVLSSLADIVLADYTFEVDVRSEDNDGIGIIFRYQDESNYYRFSMHRQYGYRRLVKCVGGVFTLLWEDESSGGYNQREDYKLRVEAYGDHLQIYINHRFSDPPLIEIHDDSHLQGNVGLYTRINSFTSFSDFELWYQLGISGVGLPPRVHDQGNEHNPSQWLTLSPFGRLVQRSEIFHSPVERDALAQLGTYLTLLPEGDPAATEWSNYSITTSFISEAEGAIGFLFRYQDEGNYYRFSMDQEQSYQRLVKCEQGEFTLLWQRDEGYEAGKDYTLLIVADGSHLQAFLGRSAQDFSRNAGSLARSINKLFDLRDRTFPNGQVAVYTHNNNGLTLNSIAVKTLRNEGIMSQLNANQLGYDLSDGQLDLSQLRNETLTALDPDKTVRDRTFSRLQIGDDPLPSNDGPAPLQIAPELNIPLCLRLTQMAPQLMLPGVASIPPDSVVLLETNPTFIASLMVGANHEMSRELLWRGFSTDSRATVFRQFWDIRGGSNDGSDSFDIAPIHEWSDVLPLEQQVESSSDETRTVFLLRSELMRMFPQAQFYLIQGESNGSGGRRPANTMTLDLTLKLPQFRGNLGPDIVYFGFDLDPDAATGADGGLGWYLAIEQPAAALRFGLLTDREIDFMDWTDLAWSDFPEDSPYIPVANSSPSPREPEGLQWGQNGAHMAVIAQRKPFRIFIHVQQLWG